MGFSKSSVLLLNFYTCIFGTLARNDVVTTTTRSYDLDVPGADPIRIVEGESPWSTSKPNSRSWRGPFEDSISDEGPHGKGKFSSSALRDFLDNYAVKVTSTPGEDSLEISEGKGKKSWNVMNVKQHNHPYDDKTGWVTMEPVPWSLSKISKWHSKSKPVNVYSANDKSWENDYDSPNNNRHSNLKKPVQNSYQHSPNPASTLHQSQVYYDNEDKPVSRPSYSRPSAQYSHTVRVQAVNQNRNPVKVNNYYNHDDCNHDENVAIITDGQPANFPTDHYEGNRRIGTELRPEPHPFMGEGEWVLLSTTKGYKVPRSKQRSLDVNPESIGTHRSVRLTVLPPLKASKVNMTTSHGGLLQVESTSETVEQAQKKFKRQQKVKGPTKLKKRPMREITASTIATIPRNTGADSSAVLAGVSAGILPATMAMLVPLAMNGKRRRKRRETPPPPTSSMEITLPRYL
ncbi:hypothetical protein NQ318_010954 [Aromia moschata]|uniref:Uncharacterized protein n=1 Tax=Aromia moschata TaxID=1265417 RepID=A0AAV8YLC4_9CUCU|nr:hypothetical protein NQ318_010954 [Aromia moschata]